MHYYIYLDESGDLGWQFEQPYKQGGSSRYLTLAYLIIPQSKIQKPKRIVRKLYEKYKINPANEKKGADLGTGQREYFVNSILDFLEKNDDCKCGTITVKKENVLEHIRNDGNKLYNYMLNLVLVHKIKDADNVNLVRDNRSIKVQSGNSLIDYLQTQIWFEQNGKALLKDDPQESHNNLNIMLIDWVSNTMWSYYELRREENFDKLRAKLEVRELFFAPQKK